MPSSRCHSFSKLPAPSAALCSTPAHEGGCFGLAFDRIGHHMASCGADKTLKLWDPATGALTATLHASAAGSFLFSPCRLAAAGAGCRCCEVLVGIEKGARGAIPSGCLAAKIES